MGKLQITKDQQKNFKSIRGKHQISHEVKRIKTRGPQGSHKTTEYYLLQLRKKLSTQNYLLKFFDNDGESLKTYIAIILEFFF